MIINKIQKHPVIKSGKDSRQTCIQSLNALQSLQDNLQVVVFHALSTDYPSTFYAYKELKYLRTF